MNGLFLRGAAPSDAKAMFRLVERMGGLELNSCYAYVLLCSHFAATSIVAHDERGGLAGFVAAYRPPNAPEDIFVWQVGVAPEHRGAGVGARLLDALATCPGAAGGRFVTATVSPDNLASRRLFASFAERRGVPWSIAPGFCAALFADSHADEDLVRVGPFLLD